MNEVQSQNLFNIENVCIGIAGLGGLGSNIAMMLARSGIRHFVLADFDIVDESNLNRQHYFPEQQKKKKTECISEQMLRLNPDLDLTVHDILLTKDNMSSIFKNCRIVCEAFDRPDFKADLAAALLTELPDTIVISGSGMAGIESANTIRTIQRMRRLYICGDGMSEIGFGVRLTAPRVQICAGHQANMVLRLLNGYTQP